jgi:hypothetical protein
LGHVAIGYRLSAIVYRLPVSARVWVAGTEWGRR